MDPDSVRHYNQIVNRINAFFMTLHFDVVPYDRAIGKPKIKVSLLGNFPAANVANSFFLRLHFLSPFFGLMFTPFGVCKNLIARLDLPRLHVGENVFQGIPDLPGVFDIGDSPMFLPVAPESKDTAPGDHLNLLLV